MTYPPGHGLPRAPARADAPVDPCEGKRRLARLRQPVLSAGQTGSRGRQVRPAIWYEALDVGSLAGTRCWRIPHVFAVMTGMTISRTTRKVTSVAAAAAALTLAVAASPAPAVADVGTPTEYTVLAADNVNPDDAAAAIVRAGGTVVDRNDAVGLFRVVSTSSTFATRADTAPQLVGAALRTPVGRAPTERPSVEREALAAATASLAKPQINKGNKNPKPGHPGKNTPTPDPLDEYLWGMDQIRAPQAQAVTPGTHKVNVGILDTGVDASNPDIAPNFNWALSRNFAKDMTDIDGPCEVASCLDPVGTDDGGHGTQAGARILDMPRRPLIAVAVIAVVLVAAFIVWSSTRPPTVPAVAAHVAPLVRTLQLSARVATASRVEVGSTLTGRVREVAGVACGLAVRTRSRRSDTAVTVATDIEGVVSRLTRTVFMSGEAGRRRAAARSEEHRRQRAYARQAAGDLVHCRQARRPSRPETGQYRRSRQDRPRVLRRWICDHRQHCHDRQTIGCLPDDGRATDRPLRPEDEAARGSSPRLHGCDDLPGRL